jgi:hypothetical protein
MNVVQIWNSSTAKISHQTSNQAKKSIQILISIIKTKAHDREQKNA